MVLWAGAEHRRLREGQGIHYQSQIQPESQIMSQSSFIKGQRWQRRHWYFIVWLGVIKRFEFCSSLSFSKSEPNSVWSQKVPTHLMVVKIWQYNNIQLLYCVAITRLVLPQPWESKKKVAILRKSLLSLFQWYSSSNPHVFNDSFFWKKSLWNLQKATSQWKVGIYSALNLKPIFSPKRPCIQCIGYILEIYIHSYHKKQSKSYKKLHTKLSYCPMYTLCSDL